MTFTANIDVTRPIAATATYISSVSIFAEINSRPTDYVAYRYTQEILRIGITSQPAVWFCFCLQTASD